MNVKNEYRCSNPIRSKHTSKKRTQRRRVLRAVRVNSRFTCWTSLRFRESRPKSFPAKGHELRVKSKWSKCRFFCIRISVSSCGIFSGKFYSSVCQQCGSFRIKTTCHRNGCNTLPTEGLFLCFDKLDNCVISFYPEQWPEMCLLA